jgi:hypothetical protein
VVPPNRPAAHAAHRCADQLDLQPVLAAHGNRVEGRVVAALLENDDGFGLVPETATE